MTDGRRPTCTIHIGPPKTGSSSIKHFIRTNEDRLDALGLFFPKLVGPNGKRARNHEQLAYNDEIDPSGNLKAHAKFWPEIEAVANVGEKNILLSSEMFCKSLGVPKTLDRVLTFFEKRGYRVVMLAYVRDQPTWLNSWYVQSQKRLARLLTFDEFVDEAAGLGRAEPARYLAPFLDNPRCELMVVPFDQAAKAGLELDFIRRCGAPADAEYERSPLRNQNAGAKTVFAAQEIMRRLGAEEGLKTLPGYPPIYNSFKRRARRLDWDEIPFVAIDQQRYDDLRSTFAEANEAFAQEHLGASWAELFPPRTIARSVFDPATAPPRELREIEKVVSEVVVEFEALRDAQGPAGSKKERRAAALDD